MSEQVSSTESNVWVGLGGGGGGGGDFCRGFDGFSVGISSCS